MRTTSVVGTLKADNVSLVGDYSLGTVFNMWQVVLPKENVIGGRKRIALRWGFINTLEVI